MRAIAPPAIHTGVSGKPAHTLGWEVLRWTAEYLQQPDGPNAGEPWRFTPEQARFVLWWYAIDEQGRFFYRRGMLRRMKGWGKDPLGAALACTEFVGPCRFGGWNGDTPIVETHSAAWIQIAAVSKDQTRNTMTLFPGMLSRQAISEYDIDLGKEIIYAFRGKCRIEAVTSSPRALEGGRSTFTLKNESHHWIESNEGIEMAAVIARNAAKSRDGSSRVLAISNAHAPGEGSDAEHDWEASRLDSTGFLYDSLEAPEVDLADTDALRAALEAARGDSIWLDIDRLAAEIQDPRTPANMARRYYLNQIAASEERAFESARWAELTKPGYLVPDGAVITLGFDGSVSRDHTALVGTEVATGHQWVAGYWEPRMTSDGDFAIPVDEVDATVDDAFGRWSVWRMNADPYYWGEALARWAGRYNKPGGEAVVSWNTTDKKRMAVSLLGYRNAMQSGELTHDGDPRFAACIANAHKRTQAFRDDNGDFMWIIEKERTDSPLKIDAAMAGCLSWTARNAAIAAGVLNQPPQWSGIFIGGGDE